MSGLAKTKPASKIAKKSKHQFTCEHCSTRFRTSSSKAKYCSTSCNQAARYLRKSDTSAKRSARAINSAFFYWLASECKRARTMQILEGHTVESLLALYDEVYKFSLRANGIDSTARLYNICHIYAAQGLKRVGMLFADNLVVAPELPNKRHGNKSVEGKGRSICRSQLKPEHFVADDESTSSVVRRVVQFLGQSLVEVVVVKGKIQTAARIKLHQWFAEHGIDVPKDENLSTQALGDLKDEHLRRQGKKVWMLKVYSSVLSPTEVYGHELERMNANPRLVAIWQKLLEFMGDWDLILEEIPSYVLAQVHQVAFNTLHGGSAFGASLVETLLSPYLRDYQRLDFVPY